VESAGCSDALLETAHVRRGWQEPAKPSPLSELSRADQTIAPLDE